MRSCIVLLLSAMLTESVSLPQRVEGFIGGSALLPCFSKKSPLERQDITARWRFNDTLNVYDIIEGNDYVNDQHSAFKNRVETFSKEYKKGNFSLKLKNLQDNDTGQYVCYEKDVQIVELLVKAKVIKNEVEEKNQTDVKSKQTDENNNQGAQSTPEKIVTIMSLLSVFTVLCV